MEKVIKNARDTHGYHTDNLKRQPEDPLCTVLDWLLGSSQHDHIRRNHQESFSTKVHSGQRVLTRFKCHLTNSIATKIYLIIE